MIWFDWASGSLRLKIGSATYHVRFTGRGMGVLIAVALLTVIARTEPWFKYPGRKRLLRLLIWLLFLDIARGWTSK